MPQLPQGEIDTLWTGVRRADPSLTRLADEAEKAVEHFFVGPREADGEFVTWQEMVHLAESRGVCRVVKRPLSVSGLSMPIGTERAILIKEGEGAERQRFTLAHEIAHLFLDEDATRQVWLRTPRGANEQAHHAIESFCDDLAGRILMPRSWLSKDLKGKSPRPSFLLELADKYTVSRQAFCIRAVKFLDRPYHVAEWSRQDGTRAGQVLRKSSWQGAARGMSRIMPNTIGIRTRIGEMLADCLARGTAAYSGEIDLETKTEAVEMRGCLVRQEPSPSMLLVTRRANVREGP